ncbi:uncharacterized protein F5Z01DRAFT_638177 [Emericellopsis atlantica]|uniref:Uncharacterized protein n=1 Tax=Emericellopsis atlantica TaxID=2614577 RepID=A0A9P8CN43_9HYPO|nr:uncharacterized protein F5Z01DRAFT_638177 [Emericellopsis atlantica]KAG9252675.1 hypothetical protein F5Z01DRAFT_638177 [Emericellopsis atlantica]
MAFCDYWNCVWVVIGGSVTIYLVRLLDRLGLAIRDRFFPPPPPPPPRRRPPPPPPVSQPASQSSELKDVLEAIRTQTEDLGRRIDAVESRSSEASTQLAEEISTLSGCVQALSEASRQSSSMTDSQGPFGEPAGHWTAEFRFRPTAGADSVGQ